MHGAEVGGACHADVAVTPALGSDRLDRVVTVVTVMSTARTEDAFGGVPTAHVLDDDGVTGKGRREWRQVVAIRGRLLAIRSADQDRRVLCVVVRSEDVGTQRDPVTHGERNVSIDADSLRHG